MAKSNRISAKQLNVVRQIMSTGVVGQELWGKINESLPNLTPVQREDLKTRIAAEYGILGHVLHDPNLYSNCVQAKKVKVASPNKDLLVLTASTPYCDTCSYRKANQCGLMGGQLVASPDNLPEQAVHRVASKLEDFGVDSKVLRTIRTHDSGSNKRVAAMVAFKNKTPEVSKVEALKAELQSRKASAILAPSKEGIDLKNLKPKKASTRQASVEPALDPKDAKVAKKVAKLGSYLGNNELTFDTDTVVSGYRDASIDANPLVDVPQYRSAGRKHTSIDEENSIHAESQLNKLMGIAGRLLGNGNMNLRLASNILDKAEELKSYGAAYNTKNQRIAHQLEVLVGSTADLEGDLSG